MKNHTAFWDFDNPLSDISPTDKPWDVHRNETQTVQSFYAQAEEFEKYAERLNGCSGLLKFAPVEHKTGKDKGKTRLKLKYAFFCRVRHCPVCQWRRSMLWRARMFRILPNIVQEYPGARWVFLTLTVRNCDIKDLRETLNNMNAAWNRLRLRKEFKQVSGWIRTTEVTRGKDASAHPHFHALLLVTPSYFRGQCYVKQTRWRDVWRETARLDYDPFVHVQTVKSTTGKDALAKAVCETLKYSVKPADLVEDPEWFLELTRQTFKLRFIATGGALKGCLSSVEDATNDELIATGSDEEDTTGIEKTEYRVAFAWARDRKRYYHRPDLDELPTTDAPDPTPD